MATQQATPPSNKERTQTTGQGRKGKRTTGERSGTTKLTMLPNMHYNIAEVGLYYATNTCSRDRFTAASSSCAYDVLRPYFGMDIELKEKGFAIFLNQACHVIAINEVSSGGLTGTVMDSRLILSLALQLNCPNLIIAHNHPSGNLTPSEADKQLTHKLKEGAKLLDHLILTAESYLSFADEALI